MVVTFVTSSNPAAVRLLDTRRLNKQRIEAEQILDCLILGKGNVNHPAVLMWTGYTEALKVYINHCIRAWRARGHYCELNEYSMDEGGVVWPWWFMWSDLHLSHKCSLLRKDPGYYCQIFRLEEEEEAWLVHGYIWPTKLGGPVNPTIAYKPETVCSPIGAGAPAQYRWSPEDIVVWRARRDVNPKTKNRINLYAKGGIYTDLAKAEAYYVASGVII